MDALTIDDDLTRLRRCFKGQFTVSQGDRLEEVGLEVSVKARGQDQVRRLLDQLLHGFDRTNRAA